MRQTVWNVLLVEDNPGDARLLKERLREIDAAQFALTSVETLAAALDCVTHDQFDVGLLDLGLPDARGLEVVRRMHEVAPDVPVLVLTALNDEAVAIRSLHEGAQDYLVKDKVDSGSLGRALRYAIERHHRQLGLLSLSSLDDLTGLSNRKRFLALANQHTKLARHTGKPFLLGFIDVDGLKHINDTFGHREGNHALVETADVLRDSFRHSDFISRYGGDEFAVLVSDAPASSTGLVAARIQEKVAIRNLDRDRCYQLSLSIGIVASAPRSSLDIEQLLHQADELMYRNKRDRQLGRDAI